MPVAGELAGLIERLERATGPDRELDEALSLACGLGPISRKNIYRRGRYPLQLIRVQQVWPPLTASIDAALALVEKVLGEAAVVGILSRAFAALDEPSWRGLTYLQKFPLTILLALLLTKGAPDG